MTKHKFITLSIIALLALACGILSPEPTITPLPPAVEPIALPTPTSEPTIASPLLSTTGHDSAVVLIEDWDTLNVHDAPGNSSPILTELHPLANSFFRTGVWEYVGLDVWEEVLLENGIFGWVNGYYLTENLWFPSFCDDDRVHELISEFEDAVTNRDAELLARITSPVHGLIIRHNWWNPAVQFRFDQPWWPRDNSYLGQVTENIFNDPASYAWGHQDGSGFEIEGTFENVILPKLDEVISGEYQLVCNDIENGTGGTAGMKVLPFEYGNFNYYALFLPPSDLEENFFNWRTWVIGIEYDVSSDPYIIFMIQYHWEI